MSTAWLSSTVTALLCAEGLLILSNADSIKVFIKKPNQRTEGETKRMQRGLVREFWIAVLLFVPVSVALGMNVVRPILLKTSLVSDGSVDALVGLVSYGFPYAAVKTITLMAITQFLKQAAAVADKNVLEEARHKRGKTDAAGA